MKVTDGFPGLNLKYLDTTIFLDGEITSKFIIEAERSHTEELVFSTIFCCSCAVSNLLKQRYIRGQGSINEQLLVLAKINEMTDGQFIKSIERDSHLAKYFPDAYYLVILRNKLSAHIIPLGSYIQANWGKYKDTFFRTQIINCLEKIGFFCSCISLPAPALTIKKLEKASDDQLHELWLRAVEEILPKLATDAIKRTESLFAAFYSKKTLMHKIFEKEFDSNQYYLKYKAELKLLDINLSLLKLIK
jgi:hypothetical protein